MPRGTSYARPAGGASRCARPLWGPEAAGAGSRTVRGGAVPVGASLVNRLRRSFDWSSQNKNPAGREGLPAGLREEVWYVAGKSLQKFGTLRPARYRIHLKSGSFGDVGMLRVLV